MALKYLVDLDLAGNEIQNVGLQTTATLPAGFAGQVVFDTTVNKAKIYNGSAWGTLGEIYTADESTLTVVGNEFSVLPAGITATELATDAVESIKIKALAVTEGKIANDAVTFTKLQNIGNNTIVGNVSGATGNASALTAAQVRTMINVADGAEVNVQSDWNATSGDALILNKPTFGDLAFDNSVNAATIDNNSVGADELNVSGDGTSGQVLTSDGDGTFSWTNKTVNTDVDVSAANLQARLADLTGDTVITGDSVRITGTLRVDGTTTYINSETVTIDDNIIVLNSNATIDETAGIEVERGGDPNTSILWEAGAQRWQFTNDGATYYNIPIPSEYAVGDITGVTAGNGLTGGGTSGTVTLNVGAGTGIAVAADTVSLSHLGFQNLTDPNADRIAFWDDSAGAFAWLTAGTNLTISGTTISATNTQRSNEEIMDLVADVMVHNASHAGVTASDDDSGNGVDLTVQAVAAFHDASGHAGGDLVIDLAPYGVAQAQGTILQLFEIGGGGELIFVMAEFNIDATIARFVGLPAGDYMVNISGMRY